MTLLESYVNEVIRSAHYTAAVDMRMEEVDLVLRQAHTVLTFKDAEIEMLCKVLGITREQSAQQLLKERVRQ